jgi:hypothetical protein
VTAKDENEMRNILEKERILAPGGVGGGAVTGGMVER